MPLTAQRNLQFSFVYRQNASQESSFSFHLFYLNHTYRFDFQGEYSLIYLLFQVFREGIDL